MERKEKKFKVCWIISLITTIIATIGFIFTVFFLVNYFIGIKNANEGGNAGEGIGAVLIFLIYLICSIISAVISVLGILFSSLARKYKLKSGNALLAVNIIYLIGFVLLFISVLIFNA